MSTEDFIMRRRQALEQRPDNDLARFSLGKALFDAGEFQEARDQFAAATQRQPDWMAAQILLGKCELSLGNRAAARAAFLRAHDLAQRQQHEGPLAEMEALLAELGVD